MDSKIKSTVLLSALVLCSFAYTQTVRGVISMNFIKSFNYDSQNGNKLVKSDSKPLFFNYTFSTNSSLQELISEEGTIIRDSLYYEENIGQMVTTTKSNLRPHEAYYYKNFDDSIFRLESERLGGDGNPENTSIKDSIPKYDWKLEEGTKTIAGVLCKKATTQKSIGRPQKIIAWYSPEIEISDGPMDFSGLPGLILEIEINDSTRISFESISINETELIEISEPKNKLPYSSIEDYSLGIKRSN